MKRAFLLLGFCLAACATAPRMVYVRTDGRATASPQLAQQLATDLTICQGEAEKAKLLP